MQHADAAVVTHIQAEWALFDLVSARIAAGLPIDSEYLNSPERQALLRIKRELEHATCPRCGHPIYHDSEGEYCPNCGPVIR